MKICRSDGNGSFSAYFAQNSNSFDFVTTFQLRNKPYRAMLIKDNDGDWGICTAAWLGMKAGTPGIPASRGRRGIPGVPGKPGYFKMYFFNLRLVNHHISVFKVPLLIEFYVFSFQD